MTLRDLKVAAVVHLYYEELGPELIQYLQNIPIPFDLYLSARPGREKELGRVFSRSLNPGKMVVQGVENRGFDMHPFLVVFGAFYAGYDVICKIHGKKSVKNRRLTGWREFLLQNLLGSPKIVSHMLTCFDRQKDLGLLFPDYFPPIQHMVEWGSNWEWASRLGKRLNLKLNKAATIDFPAGSMFWVRPKAIQSLLRLNLQAKDFESNTENLEDGTLAHALERLFLPVTEAEGYRWKKVCYTPCFRLLTPNTELL